MDGRLAYAARSLFRLVPPQTIVPVMSGPMRGQRWVVGAGIHRCWLGRYEIEKQRLMQRLLRPGDVLYDVGAHTGFFTLLGARLVGARGQVVAFEPLPANLDSLRRHVALNRLANVAIVAAAVAARPGRARFQPAGSTYMGRLAEEGSITVDVTSLDATQEAQGLRPPSLIKIDVEGAEVQVLEGASELLERHRPVILLAVHRGDAETECKSRLGARGYSWQSLVGDESELVFNPG